jgi:hypothetical protein
MVKTLEYTIKKRGWLIVPPGHHLCKARVTLQYLMGRVKPIREECWYMCQGVSRLDK